MATWPMVSIPSVPSTDAKGFEILWGFGPAQMNPESPRERSKWQMQQVEAQSLRKDIKAGVSRTKRFDATYDVLLSFYSAPDSLAVKTFLFQHDRLVKLLFAALPKIKENWGSEVKAELQLLEHPDDDSTSLAVFVLTGRADAFKALDRFDRDWWFERIGSTESLLSFSVLPE